MILVRFIARRLGGLAVTLLVASFVVYASVYLAPGSTENALFGAHPPPPETRERIRHYLGLDQPFPLRWGHWLGRVLYGDLGTSLITGQRVSDRIGHAIVITLALVGYTAIIVIVAGVGFGLLAALCPGVIDMLLAAITSVATALPAFVAASVAITVFAVQLGLFPTYGLEPGFGGAVHSLTLPAFSLATISFGLLARTTRAVAKQQLASEIVEAARARGIRMSTIVRNHVLRLSANTVVAVAGLQVAGLFAGAIVVENAFGLGGLGQLLLSSVQQKDFPVVQAIALLFVLAFVALNMLADVINAVLDPRLRARVMPG